MIHPVFCENIEVQPLAPTARFYISLGQRPRKGESGSMRAVSPHYGLHVYNVDGTGFQPLEGSMRDVPGALPQADIAQAFGPEIPQTPEEL